MDLGCEFVLLLWDFDFGCLKKDEFFFFKVGEDGICVKDCIVFLVREGLGWIFCVGGGGMFLLVVLFVGFVDLFWCMLLKSFWFGEILKIFEGFFVRVSCFLNSGLFVLIVFVCWRCWFFFVFWIVFGFGFGIMLLWGFFCGFVSILEVFWFVIGGVWGFGCCSGWGVEVVRSEFCEVDVCRWGLLCVGVMFVMLDWSEFFDIEVCSFEVCVLLLIGWVLVVFKLVCVVLGVCKLEMCDVGWGKVEGFGILEVGCGSLESWLVVGVLLDILFMIVGCCYGGDVVVVLWCFLCVWMLFVLVLMVMIVGCIWGDEMVGSGGVWCGVGLERLLDDEFRMIRVIVVDKELKDG